MGELLGRQADTAADSDYEPPAAEVSDGVADVVADNGAKDGSGQHAPDVELAGRSGHGGCDQRRLAWRGQAEVLEHDEEEDARVAVALDDVHEAMNHG